MDALARHRVLALAGVITPRVEYRDVEELDDFEEFEEVDEDIDEDEEDEDEEDLEDDTEEEDDDEEDDEEDDDDEADEVEPARSADDRDREFRFLSLPELRMRQSDNTGSGGSGTQDQSKHPHVASGPKGGQFTSTGGGGSKAAPKAVQKSAPKAKAAPTPSVPQAPTTARTMKPGDSGEDVRYAQYAMSLLGFHVDQNGSYDGQTAAAVKEIQSRLGMAKPNGHLSAAQLHKLQDAVRLSPCVGQSRSFGQDLGETRDLDDIEARHRELVMLGIPVLPLPRDDDNTIDDDTRSILDALDEWVERQLDEDWDERARDVSKELRIPGGKGGGRWTANPISTAITHALEDWGKGKGPDDPFVFDGKPIDREPLRKAAVARGITLKRGASRDDIVKALLGGVKDEVVAARTERQKRRSGAKFSINGPNGRKIDVAVYTGTDPNAPTLREITSANRPGRVVTSQPDLAGLEKWANDNGHTDVAQWAASERARAEAKSAPKAPAKKAATKAAKAAPKVDRAPLSAADRTHHIVSDPSLTDRQKRTRLKSMGLAQEDVDRLVPTKAAAAKATKSAAKKATPSAPHPDGLDSLEGPRLKSYAAEFLDSTSGMSDEQLRAALRAQGVGSPEVERAKRIAEAAAAPKVETPKVKAGPTLAEAQLDNKILSSYRSWLSAGRPGRKGDALPLDVLRRNAGDVSPEEFDAAIQRLTEHGAVVTPNGIRVTNLDSVALPARDWPKLSSNPAERMAQIQDRIEQTYHELAIKRPGYFGHVGLADVRDRVGPDVSKADFDEAVIEMNHRPDVTVPPENNQKTLTPRDRAGSVSIGNQDRHLIQISEPPAGGARPKGEGRAAIAGREALAAGQIDLSGSRKVPGVSDAERKAADLYASDAQRINSLIRDGRASSDTIRNLDSLLGRSSVSSDVELWRGLRSGDGVFGGRDLTADLTGAEFTEPGYLSTSANRRVAEQFAGSFGDPAPVVMHLVAPAGTHAVTISDWGSGDAIGGQAEVLLQRGLRMRVVADHGVEPHPQVPSGVRRLDVEIVPTPSRADQVTAARHASDVVAEVHELVGNGATPAAIRHRLSVESQRTGVDTTHLQALADDPKALQAAADKMAESAGLRRVGDVGAKPVPFDRKAHTLVGPDVESGSSVKVVRPSHVATLSSGEQVSMGPAKVRAVSATSAPTAGGYRRGTDMKDADLSAIYSLMAEPEVGSRPRHGVRKNGDLALQRIQEIQGYDGQPSVVTRSEFDRALAAGEITETYRGIDAPKAEAEVWAEQYRSGDLYTSLGRYGNGTYVAMDRSHAEDFAGRTRNPTGGAVLRIGLRSDAKVISYEDLVAQMKRYSSSEGRKARLDALDREMMAAARETDTIEEQTAVYDRYKALKLDAAGPEYLVRQDEGRFAALAGYDAIDIPGGDGGHQMIILNRTAALVEAAQS